MTGSTTAIRTITPAKVLAAIIALVVALAFVPSAAYAVSSKAVNKQSFTTTTKVIEKKATTVKKGTTKLTIKKGQGYIKFKAPATKKYTFTFSNTKSSIKGSSFVEIQKKDASSPKYSFLYDVKTKGGKANTLWLGVNGYKSSTGDLVGRCLPTRSAVVKLKKGQSLYFYFYNGSSKTTSTLKIK